MSNRGAAGGGWEKGVGVSGSALGLSARGGRHTHPPPLGPGRPACLRLTWETVQVVVAWLDGVGVRRRVSAAEVLAPPLVCGGRVERERQTERHLFAFRDVRMWNQPGV